MECFLNETSNQEARNKKLDSPCAVLSTWSRQVGPVHHAAGQVHSASPPPSAPQSPSAAHAADPGDACSSQDIPP